MDCNEYHPRTAMVALLMLGLLTLLVGNDSYPKTSLPNSAHTSGKNIRTLELSPVADLTPEIVISLSTNLTAQGRTSISKLKGDNNYGTYEKSRSRSKNR